jgi:Ca-activated chloride channel family protein
VILWGEPTFLWLLLLVPVIAVLGLVAARLRRRRLERVIDPALLPALVPDRLPGLALLKQALLLLGLALLLVAAARPKWGEQLQLYKGRGIDVVIALDGSKSMLAEDVKPNRLDRAKAELAALIDALSGNAVGIVAFAGDAHVMCPLTTDLDAAKLFLDIISPDGMPVPGTDFGRAIDVAAALFNPTETKHKALILVTDGDDLGEKTPQAVQRAVEQGIRMFPVAIATPEGAPIPEYDAQGNLREYKKDKDGNLVMSRMDERQLILIAKATNGRFLRVEGFSAERLTAELDRMRKKEIGGGGYTDYVERYQLFLIIAFVLVLAGLSLSNRRGAWLRQRPRKDGNE